MTSEPQPRPSQDRPPNQPVFLNDQVVRTEAMLTMIRTVLVRMLITTVVGAVLGSGMGYLIADMAGVWAALIAGGIGLFFTATTVVLIYLVVGRGPELLQIVLLGGWIVKMGIVLVLLLWLRTMDFFHHEFFGAVLILLALTLVTVELVTVARTRLPVVEVGAAAGSSGTGQPSGPDQRNQPGKFHRDSAGETEADTDQAGHDTGEDQVG